MKFELNLTCDNAAFFEDNAAPEIARILREVAEQLESGMDYTTERNLRDANGNKVGFAILSE